MKREEQINKQANRYTDDPSTYPKWEDDDWSQTNDIELVETAFIKGAKWADKTMIEKACEWLKDNIFDYPWWDYDAPSFNSDDIVNDFRKAMEE